MVHAPGSFSSHRGNTGATRPRLSKGGRCATQRTPGRSPTSPEEMNASRSLVVILSKRSLRGEEPAPSLSRGSGRAARRRGACPERATATEGRVWLASLSTAPLPSRNVTCGATSYYFRATQMARLGLVQPPLHCYFADSDADPPLR